MFDVCSFFHTTIYCCHTSSLFFLRYALPFTTHARLLCIVNKIIYTLSVCILTTGSMMDTLPAACGIRIIHMYTTAVLFVQQTIRRRRRAINMYTCMHTHIMTALFRLRPLSINC